MSNPPDHNEKDYQLSPEYLRRRRDERVIERKKLMDKALQENPKELMSNILDVQAHDAEHLAHAAERVKQDARHATQDYAEDEKRKEARVKRDIAVKQTMAANFTIEEQELSRRVLARRSLLAFIIRFEPQYHAGWVHKLICEKLEKFYQDVKDKKSPRLMIFMPPRAGKSMIASHYFPGWILGKDPSLEIISTSYSAQLAEGFSRKARQLLKEPTYKTLFGKTRLDETSQSVGHWSTTAKGGFVAAGVSGSVTGKGAHVLIIDDPIKNAADAGSFTVREGQKEWYESTAYTRLAPGGGVLIIQTRWHLDDLSGYLEDKSDREAGDKFEIIRFAAIANEDELYRKEGEALHPERYDEVAFARIKQAVGPKVWAALYQQNPAPDDGIYFRRQDFSYYDVLPDRTTLRFYSSWDLAIGEKEINDYTVGVIWAVDPEENIYIVNYHRGHFAADEIIDRIISSGVENKCDVVTIEKGQILMSLGPALNKTIVERKAYNFKIHPMLPGKRDKMLRARSMQARMMQGRVFFPKSFEHSEVHTEMMHFPSAKHDDFVDAMAYIGLYLDEAVPGTLPVAPKKKSWRDNISKYLSSDRASTGSMAG